MKLRGGILRRDVVKKVHKSKRDYTSPHPHILTSPRKKKNPPISRRILYFR